MCGWFSHAPKWGTWPATEACALTGNQTHNPLVYRPVLNPLSYTNQGCLILVYRAQAMVAVPHQHCYLADCVFFFLQIR